MVAAAHVQRGDLDVGVDEDGDEEEEKKIEIVSDADAPAPVLAGVAVAPAADEKKREVVEVEDEDEVVEEKGEAKEEMNEPIHMLFDESGQPIAHESPYDEKKRKKRRHFFFLFLALSLLLPLNVSSFSSVRPRTRSYLNLDSFCIDSGFPKCSVKTFRRWAYTRSFWSAS
jgi:hypothetical protein